MTCWILLDAAPEPVSTGIGVAGLAFVAIVVLMITAAVLLGAVFLFRLIRRTSAQSAAGQIHTSEPHPQTNPNQP
jgi:hypothetical protein